MPTFAAVDIGSNSVRLKIARLQAGRVRALHEDREVTRLGEGVFSSGFLNPESMAETVKVLRRFHRATQQIVTDNVRVVATSALRDARNSQAFLEWVRRRQAGGLRSSPALKKRGSFTWDCWSPVRAWTGPPR
jgi:exopolyphosphatase / guanosine-5'-triphosphate,3'-diphosphate pyrophosphatase